VSDQFIGHLISVWSDHFPTCGIEIPSQKEIIISKREEILSVQEYLLSFRAEISSFERNASEAISRKEIHVRVSFFINKIFLFLVLRKIIDFQNVGLIKKLISKIANFQETSKTMCLKYRQ